MFRPMKPDGSGVERRHLDRKTPWRLVKKYCKAAGIDPERLGGRGIGIHSLRKTAINDAIRNGAQMHEVREFAGHADIRTNPSMRGRKPARRQAWPTLDRVAQTGAEWDRQTRKLDNACPAGAAGRVADGGWRMADGGWRMADGGWRMADGGWRMPDG
ncbi:MAG: site-specific integrase [Isosphaeraceae bacterium]